MQRFCIQRRYYLFIFLERAAASRGKSARTDRRQALVEAQRRGVGGGGGSDSRPEKRKEKCPAPPQPHPLSFLASHRAGSARF